MTGYLHIVPKTEASLKRLAKTISRKEGIPHMAALDIAARRAGAEDFKAFRAALPDPRRITVTTSWLEMENRTVVSCGHSTASFRLPLPFRETFPKSGDWKSCRTMGGHVRDGFFRETAGCRRQAFEWTMRTCRAIQFMAATGLRAARWPSSGPWPKFGGKSTGGSFDRIAGADHDIFFRDPETKRLLMINEPYLDPAAMAEEREGWDRAALFDIRPMTWGGLYCAGAPIHSEMVSLRGHGVEIDEVEARLKKFGRAVQRKDVEVVVTEGTPSQDRWWPETTLAD